MLKVKAVKHLFHMVILLFSVSVATAKNDQTEVNSLSPTWSLADSQGNNHQFPQQAIENNQVTVLFFWATWCPYCKQLMPHIQSALYQYQGILNLKVYALNINEDADPQAYLNNQGYTFNLFPEAEKVAKQYQINGTPGVLVFNQKGEQVFDLRSVQTQHLVQKQASNGAKSIRLAPYWAAEIRQALQNMVPKS